MSVGLYLFLFLVLAFIGMCGLALVMLWGLRNKGPTGLQHRLAHLLSCNHGEVVTKRDDDGDLWIAFECKTCGKISHPHRSVPRGTQRNPDA